jgi:hypothetical protein
LYLLSLGREDEALQFFITYHGNGDATDELVLFEFEEMKKALRAETELKADKWRTIIKSKGSLHRMGLAALMAFMTSMSGGEIGSEINRVVFCSYQSTIADFLLFCFRLLSLYRLLLLYGRPNYGRNHQRYHSNRYRSWNLVRSYLLPFDASLASI